MESLKPRVAAAIGEHPRHLRYRPPLQREPGRSALHRVLTIWLSHKLNDETDVSHLGQQYPGRPGQPYTDPSSFPSPDGTTRAASRLPGGKN